MTDRKPLTPAQVMACALVSMLDTQVTTTSHHPETGTDFACTGRCPGCGVWQVEYVVHRDYFGSLDIPGYLPIAERAVAHRGECASFDMLAALVEASQAPVQAVNTNVDVLAHLREPTNT
jgi:hypothetical protein